MQTFKIRNLRIAAAAGSADRICYLLYPLDIPDEWTDLMKERFNISVAVITQIDWDNDLTPWKATGVPSGCPDFGGKAAEFLTLLTTEIIPVVEKSLRISPDARRTLAGVSLSGLFTLWQWLECDLFTDIISLSGSFWYEGFVDWVKSTEIPEKNGRAYFLLGDKEAESRVREFRSVEKDTAEIVDYLSAKGIHDCFEIVPGDHCQFARQRLERAFSWMFGGQQP